MNHSPHSRPLARFALSLGMVGALAAPLAASADDLPRGYYPLPEEGDLVGSVYTVEADEEDTLVDIGHDHGIGYNEMVRANPEVSIWYPGEGTQVTIPGQFILPDAPRTGIVVNVAEMRLYYYPPAANGEQRQVQTYPIAVGRMDWKTPLGTTTITEMVRNPAWYPPASIRREHAEAGKPLPGVVPPGPENPMGSRKMRLGIPGYLIHGTNKPEGVGMRVTHGCIRMLPEDVEGLFDQLSVGTRVRLVNEPFKLGWSDGTLYVQAYPYLEEDEDEGATLERVTAAIDKVDATIDGAEYPVDYSRLKAVVEVPNGVPVALEEPEPANPQRLPGSLYDHIELVASEQTLLNQISHEG
ncbi:L,D-transpeptidase family protein [Halomonas sp. V046]|uniref:L,D-transpeptidase family protein n=1 Tax=Halomonas sp. V046 TaxID=3459611 RepID=UPI0040443525